MSVFLGRAQYGPSVFKGVVMNSGNQQYAELGARIGAEIGDKVVARLKAFGDKPASDKPVTFHGGVGAASFSVREAEALVEHEEMGIGIVNEYATNAEAFAAQGVTLALFAQSRFNDEFGTPFPGMPANMPAELKSAFEKQSEKFAAKYGDGQLR